MINRVELKNFGPIEQLDWQNLGKINLVIGNNGCGKSFLLKALYSAIKTIEEYQRGDNPETDFDILWRKLYWTFQAEKIGYLVTNRSEDILSFKMLFDDKEFSYSFDKNTEKLNSIVNQVLPRLDNSIYLPAKEILSLFHIIFDSRENDMKFGFDNTYVDLVKALIGVDKKIVDYIDNTFKDTVIAAIEDSIDSNDTTIDKSVKDSIMNIFKNDLISNLLVGHLRKELRETLINRASHKVQDLLNQKNLLNINPFQSVQKKINQIIDGKIEYSNEKERWYFKRNEQYFTMGETAEGVKKIAILDTLLENGYLSEDSIIFIDEPESNLHPTAISQLLDIIAMLANQGIQFFMASHSYFIIKKLFLIAQEQQMSIPVLSYQDNQWVQSDLKEDIPDNPIVDESIRLYEEQLDLAGV